MKKNEISILKISLITLPILLFVLLNTHLNVHTTILKAIRINLQSLYFIHQFYGKEFSGSYPKLAIYHPRRHIWEELYVIKSRNTHQSVSPSSANSFTKDELFLLSNKSYENNQYKLAVEYLIIAKNSQALTNLGWELLKYGEKSMAKFAFESSYQLDPTNKYVSLNFANYLRNTGEIHEAMLIYSSYVEMYPDDPYGHYEYSYAELLSGEFISAVISIERSLNLKKDLTFYLRAAEIYKNIGRTDLAKFAYLDALSIDPNDEIALYGCIQLGCENIH
jgi:tetratricopeptide (TPR) repeat protein